LQNTRFNGTDDMRPRIYLSGPITLGDREENFSRACNMARLLINRGFAVLNPMLCMKMPGAFDIAYETWMECDLAWVEVAHGLFRLQGKSNGADREVEYAIQCGVPVFYEVGEMERYFGIGG